MFVHALESVVSGKSRASGNQLCVGKHVGQINLIFHCWVAIGSVRDLFHEKLEHDIRSHIDACSSYGSSEDFVLLSLYMIGPSKKKAAPTICFISANERERKKARSEIKASKILKKYPQFLTSDMSEDPGWGGTLEELATPEEVESVEGIKVPAVDVYYDGSEPLRSSGIKIYVRQASTMRVATGNIIRLQGRLFCFAPSHVFFDTIPTAPSRGPSEIIDFDIDDNDWDLGSEMTRSSSTSSSSSELEDSSRPPARSSTLSSLDRMPRIDIRPHIQDPSDYTEILPLVGPFAQSLPSSQPEDPSPGTSQASFARLGSLFKCSMNKDWALISLDHQVFSSNFPMESETPELASLSYEDTDVFTCTASSGSLNGTLVNRRSSIRVLRGRYLQEVFPIYFDKHGAFTAGEQ